MITFSRNVTYSSDSLVRITRSSAGAFLTKRLFASAPKTPSDQTAVSRRPSDAFVR